jgi:hypothetical protein
MVAVAAVALVVPCVLVSAFAGIVFVSVAVEALNGAVTCTVMVQDPTGAGGLMLAGIVPPVKLTMFGAVVVAVPPQVVAAEPGTTVKGLGTVSDIAVFVSAVPVGLRSVMVSVLVPPSGKLVGKNAFTTVVVTMLVIDAFAAA